MTATAIFGLWFVLAPEIVPRRLVVPRAHHGGERDRAAFDLTSLGRRPLSVRHICGVIWASTMLALLMALRPAIRRLLPGRDGTGPA